MQARTGLTARQFHDGRNGGNRGALRHTEAAGHGDLHGRRHRHRRRHPEPELFADRQFGALTIVRRAPGGHRRDGDHQTITVSGGAKPYTAFSISGFSAGTTGLTAANLNTNAAAGTVTLSGTPTAAGTASFTSTSPIPPAPP